MTRRGFVGLGTACFGSPLRSAAAAKTVAAVVTEYRWFSHADVIVGRLLGGYSENGVWRSPRTRVVSVFTHQVPQNDMSRDLASRHGFRIYPSIEGALTLGGKSLAVDAVVFVGEHGDYPTNELGQKMYPRYELCMPIFDVFEKSGRSVPLFFDKHLSYSWEKAKAIYDRARDLKVPWMAGSSIPLTVRTPVLDIPLGTPIDKAVVTGYGGLDAYGFHTLEALQCLVERRRNGETGIVEVEWIEGEAVWRWYTSDAGAWSRPLLAEALARHPKPPEGPVESVFSKTVLFRLKYGDGLEAAAFMLAPGGGQWSVALREAGGQTLSTMFGPAVRMRPLPHFDGLVYSIEEMFVTGKPQYPVERTLLTTGALSFLFESRRQRKALATRELAVTYQAPAKAYFQRS